VDFIDKEDRPWLLLQSFDDGFEALLELPAILGAGQQRSHIESIHLRIL
jgi:hypothetical protein